MNNERIKKYTTETADHLHEVIVSWIITHSCQEHCDYCISPCKQEETLSLKDHMKIQDNLIATGLTKNRYIGGEPLCVEHLPVLIQSAYEKGVNTRLSTNGILLTEHKFKQIKNYLNSIALPFESYNDDVNIRIRHTTKHRQTILSKIQMIRDSSDVGILINTCVHKENIDYLDELGYILNKEGIDHWKLRKFYSSSGRGAVPNRNRFEISDETFLRKVTVLQKMYPLLKIDGRMPSKLSTRLMISPQGDLYRMVSEKSGFLIYGNLLHDNLNIKEIYLADHCN